MKKSIIILSLILVNSISAFSQDFEGVIKYKIKYSSKNDFITVTELEKEGGKTMTEFIKNGYNKSLTDGNFKSYQLFRHDDNRIYFKHQINNDTLLYTSTLTDKAGKFEYEFFKKTDTILNIVCDKLIAKNDYGTRIFYYSSEYSLNPDFYKNYTYTNMYELMKLMKAVYLKLTLEYQTFSVDITAIDIKRKKLGSKFFALPKHKILVED